VLTRSERRAKESTLRGELGTKRVDDLLRHVRRHHLPTGDRPGSRPAFGSRIRAALRASRHAVFLSLKETPLLLAVLFVLFMTSETWQFFGRLHDRRLGSVVIVFATLTALALLFGLRRERVKTYRVLHPGEEEDLKLHNADRWKDWQAATPSELTAARLPALGQSAPDEELPLGSRTRIGLALTWWLFLNAVVVGVAAALVFIGLGIAAIDAELTAAWMTRSGEQLYNVDPILVGDRMPVLKSDTIASWELVHVAGLLGAFAALTFAVRIVTDPDLKRDLVRSRLARYEDAILAWAMFYSYDPPASRGRATPESSRKPAGD
jgi:hypothetical protein